MQKNNILTTEERFELVRVTSASSMILMITTMLQLGLAHNLKAEFLNQNAELVVNILVLMAINLAISYCALHRYMQVLSLAMGKQVQYGTKNKAEEREQLHFDPTLLDLLTEFANDDVNEFWWQVYKAEEKESELSNDVIRSFNKRLDDVYAILEEYRLMNRMGRLAVQGSISKVIVWMKAELNEVLLEADQVRISRIERKVERMMS